MLPVKLTSIELIPLEHIPLELLTIQLFSMHQDFFSLPHVTGPIPAHQTAAAPCPVACLLSCPPGVLPATCPARLAPAW